MRPEGGSVRSRVTWLVGSVLRRIFNWGMSRVLKRLSRTMAEGVAGIIDFEANRCVYYPAPSKAEKIVGDRRWYGAPGATVDGLVASPASELPPLWLVDLLRGVVDARQQGAETLDGHTARRFLAHADLNRAAEAISYQMAVSSDMDQGVDLTHMAVEVWVDDDDYIRRIRHASGNPGRSMFTSTLDLTELGIALPSDWSQIPAVPTGQAGGNSHAARQGRHVPGLRVLAPA